MADVTVSSPIDTFMRSANTAAMRTNTGLGNVDNTADTAKPVSTAQQTALDLKANLASPALTGTPTAPTATVGTNTTQLATTAFVLANAASGTGDVVGPASATANNIPIFNGTTGKLLKDSGAVILVGVTSSAGAGDSGKAPLLNGSGLLSSTFLPITAVTPGSYTNTNLTVDANGRITAAANGTGGGGSAGDLLATLVNTEISITGATTATLNTQHVCSGTSADYTVTLPSASGNAGKWLGFRMASSLTKLVTINSNIFWAQETVTFLSDGTNWIRYGGMGRSMSATLNYSFNSQGSPSGGQSIATATVTTINYDAAVNPTGLMTDTSAHTITILRTGIYVITECIAYDATTPFAASRVFSRITNSSSVVLAGAETSVVSGNYPTFYLVKLVALTAGDVLHGATFQNSGLSQPLYGNSLTFMQVVEQL